MNFTKILYNNVDVFAGLAFTPFVGRTENMVQQGERLITEETIVLRGTLTGGCTTEPAQFLQTIAMQIQLLNAFGQDFKPFDIIDDDGTPVLHRDQVKVVTVNFPTNNYGSYHIYLPFEITLLAYPGYAGDKYTAAGYHVLNPIHTVQYQEGNDGVIQIEVNTSAKGINTSSTSNNALTNAVAWVNQFKDWRPPNVSTTFGNLDSACLRTMSETKNRYEGTYERRETYVVDQFGNGPGILRYSATYGYDMNEGISTVELSGSIEGCRGNLGDNTIEAMRGRWIDFDLQAYSYAVTIYNNITGRFDLNPNPTSKNVTENQERLVISFSYNYTDDLRPPIFFDYKSSVEYDYETDSFSISVQGDVIDKNVLTSYINNNGIITTNKWVEMVAYATQVNLFALAQQAFNDYARANNIDFNLYPVGSLIVASSRTEDRTNSKLGIGATFKTQPSYLPAGWQKFDLSISCNPSLEQFKEFPCLDQNGMYQVFDLGFASRAQYSIQASGISPDTGDATGANSVAAMQNAMNIIVAQNVQGARKNLDSQQYLLGTASFDRQVSANVSVSVEGETFTV